MRHEESCVARLASGGDVSNGFNAGSGVHVCVCVVVCRREKSTEAAVVVVYNGSIDTRV